MRISDLSSDVCSSDLQQQRKNASDSLIAFFLDNEQERTGNARQACRVEGEQCTALSSGGAQSSRAYRKRRGGTGRTTSIRTRMIGTKGSVPGDRKSVV